MIRFMSWVLAAWLVGSAGAAWIVVEIGSGAIR
jgi:hypothetical protein